MSHRTQITLSDPQYERLKSESARTGLGLAELVRRALDAEYGASDLDSARAALRESFGVWRDRDLDGKEYVEHMRLGMARRLAR